MRNRSNLSLRCNRVGLRVPVHDHIRRGRRGKSVPMNAVASIAAGQSLDLGFIGDLRAVDALTGTTAWL